MNNSHHDPNRRPRIVAHRGGACEYPENSIAAFRNAARLGVDAIELDVHLSSDGVPIVIHDADLAQTSHSTGLVGERTAQKLSNVELRGGGGAMPTLNLVLRISAAHRLETLVEVKHPPGQRRYDGIELAIAQDVVRSGIIAQCTAIGFDEELLTRIKELEPRIKTCRSFGRMFLPDKRTDSEVASELVDRGFSSIMVFAYELSRKAIDSYHEAGLEVGVWTPNGPARLSYWMSAPVDFVVTDQPELAMRINP